MVTVQTPSWPTTAVPLVGRQAELDSLHELLANSSVRIVTLTGVGGVGKTRLALAAGEQNSADFERGAVFVSLAPLANAALLPFSIAQALNISLNPNHDPQAQIVTALHDQSLLLVLDNFDHLNEGAPFIAALAGASTRLKILVTSREALYLSGEQIFLVKGLPVAAWRTLDEALAADIVQLFLQKARRIVYDFALTADQLPALISICRSVDGLPLGVELAAAWVDVLSVGEIAAEIKQNYEFLEANTRDLPERQRSVRAIFDYSWRCLDDADKSALERMAVFQCEFPRQAAQVVAGADVRVLQRLVNKSLLIRTERQGYMMHALLRQYAADHLEEARATESTRAAHADYFLTLLSSSETALKGGGKQLETLDIIEWYFEDIRAAWHTVIEQGDSTRLLAAVEALFWACLMRNRYRDGESLFLAAERHWSGDDAASLALRTRLSVRRLWLERWRTGVFRPIEPAVNHLQDLLRVAQAENNVHDEAVAQMLLSDANFTQSPAASQMVLQEALDTFKRLGDDFYTAWALHFMAKQSATREGIAVAIPIHCQSLALRQRQGDLVGVEFSYFNLASDLLFEGDLDECERLAGEMLTLSEALKERSGELMAMVALALSAFFRGQFEKTETLLRHLVELSTGLNHTYGRSFSAAIGGLLALIQGDLETASRRLQDAEIDATQESSRVFVTWGHALMAAQTGGDNLTQIQTQSLRFALRTRGLGVMTWCLLPSLVKAAHQNDTAMVARLLPIVRGKGFSAWLESWPVFQHIVNRFPVQMAETVERSELESLLRDLLAACEEGVKSAPTVSASAVIANDLLTDPLTDRELEVLVLLADGLQNQEIADRLFVGMSTVKKHVTHIYDKLAVTTRTQAVLKAQELGLV